MMNYSELLKKRRSIRDFKDKPVPKDIINEILHESCLAPSACNTQPWRFIIIQDKQLMKRISDESKRCGLAIMAKYPDSPYCRFGNMFANPDYNIFYNAPALMLVVGEDNYPFFREDCTCATTYLMFAATARGLGTCWIGHAHNIDDQTLRQEIGLPNGYQIASAVVFGYPKLIPKTYVRNDLIILKSIEPTIDQEKTI